MKFKYKELKENIFIIKSESLFDKGNDNFDEIINEQAEKNIKDKNERLKLDQPAKEHLIAEVEDNPSFEDSEEYSPSPKDNKRKSIQFSVKRESTKNEDVATIAEANLIPRNKVEPESS